MEFEFEERELNSLSLEQIQALIAALLLACAIGPTIDADENERFLSAVRKLPMVLNEHVRDEVLAAAKKRYEGTEPGGFTAWLREIAGHLTDPQIREKTLCAMGHASADDLHEHDPSLLGAAIDAFEIAPDRLELIKKLFAAEAAVQPG